MNDSNNAGMGRNLGEREWETAGFQKVKLPTLFRKRAKEGWGTQSEYAPSTYWLEE